jgi:Activator of Hsp90 ATPase homolog 1-like protein
MSDLSPITFEYRLSCDPENAFDTYVERIGEWWDPRYTASAETFDRVTIEPGVAGRVYESHQGGGTYEWGEVTAWEPGRRLVHSFALAQDPAHPSEVVVEFEPAGDECLVRFAHGGWTEENVADRKKFGDWPVLLDRFAALAEG